MIRHKKLIQIKQDVVSRRLFMKGSLTFLASLGLYGRSKLFCFDSTGIPEEPRIKDYRKLGRTGFMASDISFGSGELTDPFLFNAALDAGINYIDTAEQYSRGGAERIIGTVIKKRNRKSLFISTKLELKGTISKEALLKRARKCLERLQIEYLDCLMIHKAATAEQTRNKAFHDAILELKSEGKVRFCGISCHGSEWHDSPETMENVLIAAAEDGRFDVVLMVYNFIRRDMGEKVLEGCKKKNIGTVVMKTNPVSKYVEMKEYIDSINKESEYNSPLLKKFARASQEIAEQLEKFKETHKITDSNEVRDAAVKFVLSNSNVCSACVSIKNFSELKAYLAISGTRFEAAHREKLVAYKDTFGQFYCRHACGECEYICPHKVPINTIMRYFHYLIAQGRGKTALSKYASLLQNNAFKCISCEGYCEKACPYNVPVQGLLVLAHQILNKV